MIYDVVDDLSFSMIFLLFIPQLFFPPTRFLTFIGIFLDLYFSLKSIVMEPKWGFTLLFQPVNKCDFIK